MSPYVPTYGGVAIFGPTPVIHTVDDERATMEAAFGGVNGIESLDGGSRGRVTTITGWLIGSDIDDLAAFMVGFRALNDGIARILTDTYGNAYPNVLLKRFDPAPRGRINIATGEAFVAYTATFRHLQAY